MALANPVGSSVHDAADKIDQLNLLAESQPQEEAAEKPREEPKQEPQEELEREIEEEAQEASPEDNEEDAEAEAELTLEELPGTVAEFAAEMGIDAEDLSGHLKIPVKVRGETRMVTLAEAGKGYQLEADYRQRTADLADQRRALDEAGELAVKEWQSRFQALHNLTDQLQQSIVGEKDLYQILETEGVEAYQHAKAQSEIRKAQLAESLKLKEEADQKLAKEMEEKNANYLKEQSNALLDKMPELSDEKKAKDFGDRVQQALLGYGYTAQEIAQVTDHRHYLLIRDAMAWRELKQSEPGVKNKLKNLPKVQKPGAKPEKGDVRMTRAKQKMARLKKSGSRRDAALVFEEMLS